MSRKNGEMRLGLDYPYGMELRNYALSDKTAIAVMDDLIWYPPYAVETNHVHNCMEIGMCLSGEGTIAMGQGAKPLPFSSGTVIIVPAGVPHRQQNSGAPQTRWRYIALDEMRFIREMPAQSTRDVSRLLETARKTGLYLDGNDTASEVARLIDAMFDLRCRFADDVQGELEALLLLLLVRAAREPVRREMNMVIDPLNMKSIEPALLYVAERYRQEIRVQGMARACAMSESHFRKTFRRLMGVTPLEYVNEYRVHRAMHLLHVTNMSVQSVAIACGFPSAVTFTRNFFRYVGQNPSVWRNVHAHRL